MFERRWVAFTGKAMRSSLVMQIAKPYATMPCDVRSAALAKALEQTPRCPVTRYLAGCEALDAHRPATAVRHMMVAHHSAPEFQSAALLVFAGLSWVEQAERPLLNALLDTWEEFRRPSFDQTAAEQVMLDCFAEPEPSWEGVSTLARKLWRLPILMLREQIREVASDPKHAPAVLWSVPV